MNATGYDDQLFAELYDVQPQAIVWSKPVLDEDHKTVIDFEYTYCNDEGLRYLNLTRAQQQGLRVSTSPTLTPVLRRAIMEEMIRVYQTGERSETNIYNPALNKYARVLRTRLRNGVLTVVQDRTEEQRIIDQQQKQTRQLAARSHYLNSILNTSLNAVIAVEAVRSEEGGIVDLRYRQVNTRFLQWFAKTEDEVIGETMLRLFPGLRETGIFEALRGVIESGTPLHTELAYQGSNRVRWYELSIASLDRNSAVCTFYETTEKRVALEQLTQQKTLLDNLLQFSPAGISVTEVIRNRDGHVVDGRTLLANEAAIKYIGLPKKDALTKTVRQVDPAMLDSPLFQQALHTLETGKPFQTQYFFAPTERWLELSVARMDHDHLINIFTDVTAAKQAQLQVEQTTTQLHAVFNAAQSGMLTLRSVADTRGEVVDFRFGIVNPAYAEMVGYTIRELQGCLVSTFFPSYLSNGVFDLYRHTYQTGASQRQDVHYHFDGLDVYLDLLVTRVGNDLLVTFTNYTPLKKTQVELETLVDELRRSNTSLEEFAHAASHDLKEPIRKISTFIDRIKSSLADRMTAGERDVFERMQLAALRMAGLVDDLLMYSHLSLTPLEMEEVNLNDKLRLVLSDLELLVEEKNARVHLEPLPVVKGYRRQLQQLFQNLLSNALKYSKPGAAPQITVRSHLVKGAAVPLELPSEYQEKFYHLIEVRDNGIGFEPQHAVRIFEVFKRLHGQGDYPGTGVGLAIARRVVDNHKGYIWAESEPGKGASFKILLPANTDDAAVGL